MIAATDKSDHHQEDHEGPVLCRKVTQEESLLCRLNVVNVWDGLVDNFCFGYYNFGFFFWLMNVILRGCFADD